jgi:hypothetical protein
VSLFYPPSDIRIYFLKINCNSMFLVPTWCSKPSKIYLYRRLYIPPVPLCEISGQQNQKFHVRLLFHARTALLEVNWFKWTHCHELRLLYPQRCYCCQPRRPALSRCWERFYASLLGGEALRRVVLLPSPRVALSRAALSAKLLCCII